MADNDLDLQRSFGRMEGRLMALEQRVAHNEVAQERGFANISLKLDAMSVEIVKMNTNAAKMSGEDGGRNKTLALIGATVVSVLSLLVAGYGALFGH